MMLFWVKTAPPPASGTTLPAWPSPVSLVTLPDGDVDPEHRCFHHVLGGDQDRLAVLGPGDRADRAVPVGGDRADLAGGEVADLQHLPVGFVAGPRHREIGEAAAVGRQRRQIVGAVIVRREVGRLGRSVGGRGEDVEVGRGRLDPTRFAQREIDRAAVGRNVDFLAAAERLGRRVADQRAGHRDAGAGYPAAFDREGEDAAADAGLGPGVPVANEQLVIDAARPALVRPLADRRRRSRGT